MRLKKKIILVVCAICLTTASVWSQVSFSPQLPPSGITQKRQLWNGIITNTISQTKTIKIILKITDVSNGNPVLSGSGNQFSLATGSKTILPTDVSPITYVVLTPSYPVDISEDGLLPVGTFNVCYQIFGVDEGNELLAEECETIEVEPLSPPQLTYPADSGIIEETRPLFSWIPPSPVNLLSALSYDFKLVEVFPNQNSGDAIQLNVPLYQQNAIQNSLLQYPASALALDTGKIYAWQITAKNNGTPAGVSEIWTFRIADSIHPSNTPVPELPYFKLIRGENSSYYRCVNELKFEYNNEPNDATVEINLFNISKSVKEKIVMDNSMLSVRNGENLIKLDLTAQAGIKNGGIYLLEIRNSKGELWTGKFLYIKKL